jgi:16S rRNA processing protein RimM
MTPPDQTPEDDASDPWIAVAKILRPHGLRGTFRLKPLTGNDDDLIEEGIEEFNIRLNDKIVRTVKLDSIKLCGDLLHAKFLGVKDRTEAEQYTNGELVIRESQRWDLEEGEYYTDDLKNLTLLDHETGEVVGVAIEAMTGPAHNYLLIARLDDLKKTEYLPFIPEFVMDLDLKKKTARVAIPDGLFDPPPPPPQLHAKPAKPAVDDDDDSE